jgi:hypothetical protein
VEGFYTRNIQFAFGHGGGHPGHVSSKCGSDRPIRNARIALAADGIH